MSANNLRRLNIDIDKDLKMAFKVKTIQNGDTMTEVLTRAIEEYLNEE